MIKLDADQAYWDATEEDRRICCNGCGAKGGLDVPDTIYWLSMTEVCNIHDWGYKHGKDICDKQREDLRMLYNMLLLIEAQTGWRQVVLKPLRRRRALKYYEAVITFGSKAFWAEKGGK